MAPTDFQLAEGSDAPDTIENIAARRKLKIGGIDFGKPQLV